MNHELAAAIGRALEETRAGNPGMATRIIQSALGTNTRPGSDEKTARPLAESWAKASPGGKRPALSRVIELLARGSGQSLEADWKQPPIRPAVPEGARYLERRHASAYGGRDYRLFLPSDRAQPVQGVLLMLHGCTQSADDFAAGTRMNVQAERDNLIVVYAEQERAANPMACWNWFRPGDQARGGGEPALLADLIHAVATEFGAPADRIFAAGLSAGGAMAAILGQAYPDLFSAVGVHSGLAPGSASDVAGAYAAMHGNACEPRRGALVRTIVFHGDADQTVHPRNASGVLSAALGNETTMEIENIVQHRSGRSSRCVAHRSPTGRTVAESWTIEGAGHAWSGGAPEGSHTDPEGPDASAEMVRFFLASVGEAHT